MWKKRILSFLIITILLVSANFFITIDNSEGSINITLDTIENSQVENIQFTEGNAPRSVFCEEGTATWCTPCVTAGDILYSIYESGDYPFYYIAMVTDKQTDAYHRLYDEYNVAGFPTLFFDGGHTVKFGSTSTDVPYREAIETCRERTDVPNLDMDMTVLNANAGTFNITLVVKNNENAAYQGYLRIYVTEIISRWNMKNGEPYHFALLDYASEKTISIDSRDTFVESVVWNGTEERYTDVRGDNVMVMAAVFNDEKHTGYANPPSGNPFDAYYVDAVTIASPINMVVYVDDDYTPVTPGWRFDHFDNIQDGIDAVEAGGTVYVYTGTYFENLVVDKSISLIGEDRHNTIIKNHDSMYTVHISADFVTLNNFTIQGDHNLDYYNASIKISEHSSHDTVTNCNLLDDYYGIWLYSSKNNDINNCTFSQNTIGIWVHHMSNYNSIHDCTLSNNSESGIYFCCTSAHNTIYHNTISFNGVGAKVDSPLATLPDFENTFYLNNFINNSQNARNSAIYKNFWDNGSMGNYWSDYDEENEGAYDNDSNGIVDSPYVLSESQSSGEADNYDNYPLMYPWKSGDNTPPLFITITCSLPIIPEDTDSNLLFCTENSVCSEVAHITVTLSDTSSITSVDIDLSSLGWSTVPMIHIPGTYTWYILANAIADTAVYDGTGYAPKGLVINATDEYGNWNIRTVNITVWKNGDVSGDGVITLYDATYLAKWYFNQPGFEYLPENVADVSGDCQITLYDATYLAKWYFNQSGFEELH